MLLPSAVRMSAVPERSVTARGWTQATSRKNITNNNISKQQCKPNKHNNITVSQYKHNNMTQTNTNSKQQRPHRDNTNDNVISKQQRKPANT